MANGVFSSCEESGGSVPRENRRVCPFLRVDVFRSSFTVGGFRRWRRCLVDQKHCHIRHGYFEKYGFDGKVWCLLWVCPRYVSQVGLVKPEKSSVCGVISRG